MGRKVSDANNQFAPALNVAHIGQLNLYVVHEHELDKLAEGSPATLAFNGAVAFISLAAALLLTVTTTTITKNWLFNTYLFFALISSLPGQFYSPIGGKWAPQRERSYAVSRDECPRSPASKNRCHPILKSRVSEVK